MPGCGRRSSTRATGEVAPVELFALLARALIHSDHNARDRVITLAWDITMRGN
jgi:hypothetical protein